MLDLTDGDTTSHAYADQVERIALTDVSPYLQGHSAFYYDFNKNKYKFASNVFAFASFKCGMSEAVPLSRGVRGVLNINTSVL